jgi:hypothetical protein
MSIFDRPGTTPPIEDPYRGMGDIERELAHRLRIVEDKLLVLSGADGSNGKLGNLTKRVDGHDGLIKWIGGGLGGVALLAAAAIYAFGQDDGAAKQEEQYQRAAIERLQRQVEVIGAPVPYRWPANPTGDDR